MRKARHTAWKSFAEILSLKKNSLPGGRGAMTALISIATLLLLITPPVETGAVETRAAARLKPAAPEKVSPSDIVAGPFREHRVPTGGGFHGKSGTAGFVEHTTQGFPSVFEKANADGWPGKLQVPHDHWNTALAGRWGGGPTLAATKNGDIVYHGMGAYLEIVDVSNPSSITPLGRILLAGKVEAVAAYSGYLYTATGSSGLRIVNVSDPTNPVEIGSIPSVKASDVLVSGNLLYVAGAEDGLFIYDISTPTSPSEVGRYGSVPVATLTLSDTLLYVTDGYKTMYVLNVKNLSSISELSSYHTLYFTTFVSVSGNYAYLSDATAGLTILDVTDPSNPEPVGFYNSLGSMMSTLLSGNILYYADGYYGIGALDVSDPTSPLPVGSGGGGGNAHRLFIEGSNLYVADGLGGLKVFEVSVTSPGAAKDLSMGGTTVDFTLLGSTTAFDVSYRCTISGDYAYVATQGSGITVLDISDPYNPSVAGHSSTVNSALNIALSGNYAYVAVGATGIEVFDVSDPTNPTSLTYEILGGGNANAIAMVPGYLLVTNGQNGLSVVDISSPEAPELVTTFSLGTSGFARDIAVQGDYAYVADGTEGLKIIDVTNPLSPSIAATYDTDMAYGVEVSGNYAYIADYTGGLVIVDVSNPLSPTLAGTSTEPAYARDVDVSGDYAFVCDDINGLLVIDVSDRSSPVLAGYYRTDQSALGVLASGDYAYVCDGTDGLYRIEFSQSTELLITSLFARYSKAIGGVSLSWTISTSADESIEGIFVLRCEVSKSSGEDAGKPVVSPMLPADCTSWVDVNVESGKTYIYSIEVEGVDRTYRSEGIRVDVPAVALTLEQNFPNPFNPSTSITFFLPQPMRVSLDIYTPGGKLVKRLLEAFLPSGKHTAGWDGTNEGGAKVSSGVYLYRLTAGKKTITRKMVLLK